MKAIRSFLFILMMCLISTVCTGGVGWAQAIDLAANVNAISGKPWSNVDQVSGKSKANIDAIGGAGKTAGSCTWKTCFDYTHNGTLNDDATRNWRHVVAANKCTTLTSGGTKIRITMRGGEAGGGATLDNSTRQSSR